MSLIVISGALNPPNAIVNVCKLVMTLWRRNLRSRSAIGHEAEVVAVDRNLYEGRWPALCGGGGRCCRRRIAEAGICGGEGGEEEKEEGDWEGIGS